MSLELFTRKGGRYGTPRITITTAGQIGLNASCLSKYFKGEKYALLYGDKDKKIIGIKPSDKNEDNAFKITYSQKGTTASISGHSFLRYLELDFSKSRRFAPEWKEKDGLLVINVT